MVNIIKNACSQSLLDFIMETSITRETWHWKFPNDAAFNLKHPKLDIVEDGIMKDDFLAGITSAILVQIWELNDRKEFIPEIFYCGVSIKDKHRKDNIHVDDPNRDDTIKIMGILNHDWNAETMGGGFMHGGVVHKLRPTDFCIFDPRVPHAADEIICDDKRFALDFSVKKT